MPTVAVISDTHLPRGARVLPAACLERLAAADLVLHAGDVTTEPVLAELRALGPPLIAVHGNVDEPALQARLPRARVIEVGGVRIGMVHVPGPTTGRSSRLRAAFPGCVAIVYGHTHLPEVEQDGGVWLLNPGSPTERRRAPAHTMIELRVEAGALEPTLLELS